MRARAFPLAVPDLVPCPVMIAMPVPDCLQMFLRARNGYQAREVGFGRARVCLSNRCLLTGAISVGLLLDLLDLSTDKAIQRLRKCWQKSGVQCNFPALSSKERLSG